MVDRVPEGLKLVEVPRDAFDYKTNKEGGITKLMARLVARGQIRGVDSHASLPLAHP